MMTLLGGFEQTANQMERSQRINRKYGKSVTPISGCGFVQNIPSPTLSRNRKIKTEQIKTTKLIT